MVGEKCNFKTIQSAIEQARKAGGGTIYVEPGQYNENLHIYPQITIEGCGIADLRFVCISGIHILPDDGSVGFNHILFCNESSIFLSTKKQSKPNLLFRSCMFEVKSGYLLDIPFMDGSAIFFDCCSKGENNGFINNIKGSCILTLFNMTIDCGGQKNRVLIQNQALLFNLHILGEIEFSSPKCVATINGGCWIENTIVIKNRAHVKIACSNSETKTKPAFVLDNGFLELATCAIDSHFNKAIVGHGQVRMNGVSFISNSTISKSIKVIESNELSEVCLKVGKSGRAQSLPSRPCGYLTTKINGKEFLIPYYNKHF